MDFQAQVPLNGLATTKPGMGGIGAGERLGQPPYHGIYSSRSIHSSASLAAKSRWMAAAYAAMLISRAQAEHAPMVAARKAK